MRRGESAGWGLWLPSGLPPSIRPQAIARCASELKQLGVFTSTGGNPDALTWEQIRRRSRQYFSNICEFVSLDSTPRPARLQ